jgi:hypothetical protein
LTKIVLFLALVVGENKYEWTTFKVETIFTCYELFNAAVEFKTKHGVGTYPEFLGKPVAAYYCKDEQGNYVR